MSHLTHISTLPSGQVGLLHFASRPGLRTEILACIPFPAGLPIDYGNPDSNNDGVKDTYS